MKKIILLLGVFCLLIVALFVYYHHGSVQKPHTTTSQAPSKDLSDMLASVAVWWPDAPWTNPAITIQTTSYGKLSGADMQATVTSPTASMQPFENTTELSQEGFVKDTTLDAGGAGSATWGYKRVQNGKTQILLFSYATTPTSSNPNEPLQFACPCKQIITVFVSKYW